MKYTAINNKYFFYYKLTNKRYFCFLLFQLSYNDNFNIINLNDYLKCVQILSNLTELTI